MQAINAMFFAYMDFSMLYEKHFKIKDSKQCKSSIMKITACNLKLFVLIKHKTNHSAQLFYIRMPQTAMRHLNFLPNPFVLNQSKILIMSPSHGKVFFSLFFVFLSFFSPFFNPLISIAQAV